MIGEKVRGARLSWLAAWVTLALPLVQLGMQLGPAVAEAQAEEQVQFTATVDRQTVGEDDSVALKMSVQVEGSARAGQPSFKAPDFETINEYNSTFVESFYNNGKFGVKNNFQLTKVLRPLKTGNLSISDIKVTVEGKTYTAPDLIVQVTPAGAATPPPRNYGGGGVGLRGSGKRQIAPTVMVRAEIDKDKAYKGEQIIVSYYLYQRAKVFNIAASKFPQAKDVLREELEMPMMGTQLTSDRVVLDGVPYQRALLARYAIYPLKEGKLRIDPLGIKYSYYATNNFMDDGEDPFLNFFQQMTPRTGSTQSETVTLEVLPLPSENRPSSFTGAVGDFNITAAVDKYDVRANEAVTLIAKVEGRGNLAAIGEPKAQWPDGVELYDSKGVAKAGKGGLGEKVFEFLLIPRVPGKLKLPALDFSYFDTQKKAYVTRMTDPVEINVQEPAPGSAVAPPPVSAGNSVPVQSAAPDGLRTLKAPKVEGERLLGFPIWRVLYLLSGLALVAFLALVGWDLVRKGVSRTRERRALRSQAESRSWARLKKQAREAVQGASWSEVLGAYDTVSSLVLETLDKRFALGARSLPRSELRRFLVEEHGAPEADWKRIERLLERAEIVRFASPVGGVSEDTVRLELSQHIEEAESLVQVIENWKPRG